MIPFDITKIEVQHVHLKSCTTALGGSISILDEKRSTPDNEVFTKIKVPFNVVRAFIKQHEIRNYLKPVLCAVTFYDNHVVAIERHQLAGLAEDQAFFDGIFNDEWISSSEMNIDRVLMPLTSNGEWFTDGTFVFSLRENIKSEKMSSDGRFLAIPAYTMKFANIHTNSLFVPDVRTCLRYVASTGQTATTSPIWKSLNSVGNKQLSRMSDSDDETLMSSGNNQFDRIDRFLAVNLSFALKAGKELSELFGFEAIEPLQLDDLMIKLRTVNLPRVANEIKQTFDIGIPFTHAVAWLIGLFQRVHTLDSYIVLRSLLKYLTTKGFYRKNAFTPDAIFKEGFGADDIPLMTVEEAAEFDSLEDYTMSLSQVRQHHQRNRLLETGGSVGTLFDAD